VMGLAEGCAPDELARCGCWSVPTAFCFQVMVVCAYQTTFSRRGRAVMLVNRVGHTLNLLPVVAPGPTHAGSPCWTCRSKRVGGSPGRVGVNIAELLFVLAVLGGDVVMTRPIRWCRVGGDEQSERMSSRDPAVGVITC